VWTNLIDNSIDAMGGKGEIQLRTRQDGEWVVVEIEDNGPGIPPAIQANIFDPFFTTKAPGQGTGMGLNISYNIIVQRHKGKIDVHSGPGKTRFEVRLPLHSSTPT
jgi:signal transduction histidine kinase